MKQEIDYQGIKEQIFALFSGANTAAAKEVLEDVINGLDIRSTIKDYKNII